MFSSAYGWTVEEVDNLTVQQMLSLLEQIKKYPPTNVLLAEFIKGLGGNKEVAMETALGRIPNVKVEKKQTNRTLKVVNKRTGKRIK